MTAEVSPTFHEQIRRRAYDLYEKRGRQPGHDLDDWLEAERGLLSNAEQENIRAQDFISEDDLKTFTGWLRYQGIDSSTASPEDLEAWRGMFEEVRKETDSAPKVGLMKLRSVPGEYRYAVALRESSALWIGLWIRRSRRGEFFVFLPRNNTERDVHTSYHLDGTLHTKSFGQKALSTKVQPLTGTFRGTQNIGMFAGYGPKGVGAICDPAAFAGIIEVGPGILGPKDGVVSVDLVEPGCEPIKFYGKIVQRVTFRHTVPWMVITVGSPSAT